MKKLHLRVDELRVETFSTQRQPRATGTVRAHEYTETCGGSCFSDLCFPTDVGCGTFGCGTRVMSCNAADCTHEN
ncbi:MAG TPA: hypothetical protein VFS20_14170 [Longimicrobium sp.]|nr:hypothetical protein [Longimicrobium sp.]